MKPVNVRLQNCTPGMGIERDPVICWEYHHRDGEQQQKACGIRLYKEDEIIYDSKMIETDKQNDHQIPMELESHQKYKVSVTAVNQFGIEECSEKFAFISGISHSEHWHGRWISNGSHDPHYLGKDFILDKTIRSAYLSCAGVGQYKIWVNEKEPDDSLLNGSWTDYNKHIHYRTFDITDLLNGGYNKLQIEVGNGWYHAISDEERHFYTMGMGYQPFGEALAAMASLTIVYENGEKLFFGTDEDWYSRCSETIYTNIFGSEDYDARLENNTVREPVIRLIPEKSPKGVLVPMCYPPVKTKEVYAGVLIKKMEDGSHLYDLGQNMSGLFEIAVRGNAGTKVRILPVEKLDIQGNPWKTTESWCSYTLNGNGLEKWMPKFTYGAGRYLHISVDPADAVSELPEIISVSGHFITSSAKDVGEFYCSDHRYMQIHDLVLRAVESNLNHVHTDCPTIEKLGWQEPNHLMAPSIFYTKDAATLWEKISGDQRDSQYMENEYDLDTGAYPHKYGPGLLPSIAPRYARFLSDGGEGSFWDIIPWGSSILLGAYEKYRFTGSRGTLIDNYDTAVKYLEYLYQKYQDYPKLYGKPKHLHFLCHGLGDWGIEQNRGESRENIETAYFYRDLVIIAEIAGWLGQENDQAYYEELAAEVLNSYNQTLLIWNPQTGEWAYDSFDKTGISPTQAAQAIPLQFKMVPEDKRESVERSFLLTCEQNQLHSGEIGLPYILRTLGELKQPDLVHNMIFQEFHPSYYRFIRNGETTLPEFWRDDSRSRNHDMMGAVLEWFYRYMAGISSEDGYRHICISPSLPGGINCIKCSYKAITGSIDITVLQETELKAKVRIPVNTTGEVWLGSKCMKIQGGRTYHLTGEKE